MESANAPILGQIEVAPPDGDVEVKLVLMADPTVADEVLYQLEVAVSYLKERFGDFFAGCRLPCGGIASPRRKNPTLSAEFLL